jgi:GDPmannose 4,6-dehydratase
MSKALVIGHNGQDGTYLSQLLRDNGYNVIGIGKESDVTSAAQMRHLLAGTRPDEIYYLAAYHHASEDAPVNEHELISTSLAVNTNGLNNILGAVVAESLASRVFYAGSSRMFGEPTVSPQNETTPLRPLCAYGISKVAAMEICAYYRATRNVFACAGILYNHESPRRAAKFISRKIVRAAVQIARGSKEKLTIGNLDARVDWGYAPDYVRAMWQILQLAQPADFVIGSGILHSVRDFVEAAFNCVGLNWESHVLLNPNALGRKAPQALLVADCSKLRSLTGWQPEVDFRQMVQIMVDAEKNCL